MRILLAAMVLAGFLAEAPSASAGQLDLIREVEKLRNSLGPKDPARGELSLRLADLYFYQGAELAKQADLAPEDPRSVELGRQATQFRLKSLNLYREQQPAAQGERRTKILFQMARLTQDLGQRDISRTLWKELAAQQVTPSIRNEAVLRLGEMSEEDGALPDAERYYSQVIQECSSGDLCPYVRFRLAWLMRNQGRFGPAIAMMKESLWDSKGMVREDSLRDLIVFYAAQPSDGEAALADVDALAARLNRPELLSGLADGFFSNGNKPAAVRVLEFVDARAPSLSRKIRLLEELYGLRRWDAFREQFQATTELPLSARDATESSLLEASEKTLRRLVVQLDGERIGDASRLGDFQGAVMLYLRLFPTHPDKFKLMEGWIAAEPDAVRKEQKLKEWMTDATLALTPEQLVRLREIRIASAQKNKRYEIVVEEAAALSAAAKTEAGRREFDYARARALYELKSFDEALAGFQKLAAPPTTGEPDRFAVLSQNLALDILAQRKDYAAFLKQAELWLGDVRLQKVSSLSKELADLSKMRDEVVFEQAAQPGDDARSLETFLGFCRAGKLAPKSCQNAKVLAATIPDQAALIELLKLEGDRVALANELEAAGRFAEAAAELEAMTPLRAAKWSATDALKIALLYELGGKVADQKRWLTAFKSSLEKSKTIRPSEELVYRTLADADLLDEAALKLPWSKERLAVLAHDLEEQGRGSARTRKLLLDSKVALGPTWSRLILEQVNSLASAQKKISFYGKNSRSKFQARIQAIQKVDRFAKPYLEGADIRTRVQLLTVLRQVYEDFAAEVLGTPIPDGLDEATLAQVKASLDEMADPFRTTGADYARLVAEQSARLPADAQSDAIALSQASPRTAQVQSGELAAPLARLRANPRDVSALEDLKRVYESGRQIRLASYFEGRIQQLKEKTP